MDADYLISLILVMLFCVINAILHRLDSNNEYELKNRANSAIALFFVSLIPILNTVFAIYFLIAFFGSLVVSMFKSFINRVKFKDELRKNLYESLALVFF